MKKMTMQLLAESLQLSRVTVWKVLNGKEGVAPETVKRVREAVALFKEEHKETEPVSAASPKSVTVLMRNTATSMFWMSIVNQLFIDLNKYKMKYSYTLLDDNEPVSTGFLDALSPDKTSGLIVINLYSPEILRRIAAVPVPKVFYDTVPAFTADDLRGDLLLVDGKSAVERITRALIDKGCRRLGFIGDIEYARTNRMRWDGFKTACDDHGVEIESRFCLTKSIKAYPAEVEAFLHELTELPDGFVCVNDHMACLVYNLLHEKRCRIPDDLLLTGFDDTKEFMLEYHNITTVHVQKSMLGRRLLSQLIYRMENPEADHEEILIRPEIIFRGELP